MVMLSRKAMMAGAFVPSNIAGLVLWLRADDISGNDGDPVDAWVSREGNSYSFEQTLTKRPLLKLGANGINNQPAVRFDGSNDLLRYAGTVSTATSGTLFIVFRLNIADNNSRTLIGSCDEASVNYYWFILGRTDTANPYIRLSQRNADTADLIFVDEAMLADTKYLLTVKSTGTAYSARLNQTAETLTVNSGANNGNWIGHTANRDSFTIGAAKITSEVLFLHGDIAEIILYDAALSDGSIAKVEAYLTNRYGPFLSTLMVAFGDSVVGGTGASTEANRWVNIVANNKSWKFINSGLGGTVVQNTVQNTVSTIGGAVDNNSRDTYTTRVTGKYPDYVLILYGLNDLRLNDVAFTTDLYENDLNETIQGIIDSGVSAQNIVIGSPSYMNPANYGDYAPWDAGSTAKHEAYVAKAAAVAANKGTKYIDVYQWMIDNGGNSLIGGDGIHPNDAGHAAIANAFLSVL